MKKKEREVFHGAKELFFRSVTPLIASRDHFVPFILTPRSLTSLCLDESSRPPRQSVFQVHRRELSTADSRHFRGIIFPSIHTLNPRRISLSRRLSIFSLSFFFFFLSLDIFNPRTAYRSSVGFSACCTRQLIALSSSTNLLFESGAKDKRYDLTIFFFNSEKTNGGRVSSINRKVNVYSNI